MEIDHVRPKCFRCHKQGHKAKICRLGRGFVSAVSQSNNSDNSVRPRTAKNIDSESAINRDIMSTTTSTLVRCSVTV